MPMSFLNQVVVSSLAKGGVMGLNIHFLNLAKATSNIKGKHIKIQYYKFSVYQLAWVVKRMAPPSILFVI